MAKAALFIIDGFEETEAVVTADLLRRANVDLKIVSLNEDVDVEGAVNGKHGITVLADEVFENIIYEDFDMLIIPGGTTKYMEHDGLVGLVGKYHKEGKKLAAICAAPAVFGKAKILDGYRATIYPDMEEYLGQGAIHSTDDVVTDRNITTSRGPATAMKFGLCLVEILQGPEVAANVAKHFLL
ncbi:4-methyl-5(b-hydroxyethyl)-thiazole monophosphate biosynthesis [Elusimicrobium simillimum]|uniref:DJ-1 family glyoxalase III n=1 Tax=Elusimicrobium simillimum TaxID=3143438 RepID=UPI003C703EC5